MTANYSLSRTVVLLLTFMCDEAASEISFQAVEHDGYSIDEDSEHEMFENPEKGKLEEKSAQTLINRENVTSTPITNREASDVKKEAACQIANFIQVNQPSRKLWKPISCIEQDDHVFNSPCEDEDRPTNRTGNREIRAQKTRQDVYDKKEARRRITSTVRLRSRSRSRNKSKINTLVKNLKQNSKDKEQYPSKQDSYKYNPERSVNDRISDLLSSIEVSDATTDRPAPANVHTYVNPYQVPSYYHAVNSQYFNPQWFYGSNYYL